MSTRTTGQRGPAGSSAGSGATVETNAPPGESTGPAGGAERQERGGAAVEDDRVTMQAEKALRDVSAAVVAYRAAGSAQARDAAGRAVSRATVNLLRATGVHDVLLDVAMAEGREAAPAADDAGLGVGGAELDRAQRTFARAALQRGLLALPVGILGTNLANVLAGDLRAAEAGARPLLLDREQHPGGDVTARGGVVRHVHEAVIAEAAKLHVREGLGRKAALAAAIKTAGAKARAAGIAMDAELLRQRTLRRAKRESGARKARGADALHVLWEERVAIERKAKAARD